MSEDMVQWLYDLQHFGVKLGLDNIRGLLSALGHPERSFATVHIAGTNGKGSVASMLDAMLNASCVRSGLFTSPHLMRPNERIRLAGTDISDEELHRQLAFVRDRIQAGLAAGKIEVHPSFFEVIAATAIQSFKEHGCEASVLEVGLGGRLDATNAVNAEVSVVVSVGLDHTKTLGGTLEAIAGEKGGIIKKGQRFINGTVQQRVINVLRRIQTERGATWIEARLATRFVKETAEGLSYETDLTTYDRIKLSLPGKHQIDNARIAITAYEQMMQVLGRKPDPNAVRHALANVRWAGRLQWIEARDGHPAYLLDGAHNMAGMQTLVTYLDEHEGPKPTMLFGATRGKPVEQLLAALEGRIHSIVIVRPPVEKGLDAWDLEPIAAELFDSVHVAPDVEAALKRSRELAGSERPVLITGSLYLIGHALNRLERQNAPGPVPM